MAIPRPYLLFLGEAEDPGRLKTAMGLVQWRREDCVGEHALTDTTATTGLPRMSLAEGRERGARSLILGLVHSGGRADPKWTPTLLEAIALGYDLVAGMHDPLADVPELRAAADAKGTRIHDLRVPPKQLPIGTGRPRDGRRLLTVGTDCAVGKMFTALALEQEFKRRGLAATFRATGQTGIAISGSGIPVDAVPSDFVSGSVEQLAPANAPDHWDLIEGQGSLLHPSFAAVTLGLVHGAAPHRMVLCHEPGRSKMRGDTDHQVPSLTKAREAHERAALLVNSEARVVAIALNTSKLDSHARARALEDAANETGLPSADASSPEGIAKIADAVLA